MPDSTSTLPGPIIEPARVWVPLPFITRLIAPELLPSIVPLKVFAPPMGLRVKVQGTVTALLVIVPPPDPATSDRRVPSG